MIARLLISSSPNTLAFNLKGLYPKGIITNHPDILYFKAGEKLGIAEARKIKEHFSLKPYSQKGRTVVIEDASVMTDEAQNALLKTLEELPEEALFIMGSTSDANFLPTISSRCQITYLTSDSETQDENISKLLNLELEERFEYVEKIKNREQFLKDLVSYFHQNILKYPKFSAQLLEAEKWAKQNVNIRAILEYLMLVMPASK